MEMKLGNTNTEVRKVIICVLVFPETEIISAPPTHTHTNDKTSILTKATAYILKTNRENSKF